MENASKSRAGTKLTGRKKIKAVVDLAAFGELLKEDVPADRTVPATLRRTRITTIFMETWVFLCFGGAFAAAYFGLGKAGIYISLLAMSPAIPLFYFVSNSHRQEFDSRILASEVDDLLALPFMKEHYEMLLAAQDGRILMSQFFAMKKIGQGMLRILSGQTLR